MPATSVSDRPLRIRMRPDLVSVAQLHGTDVTWIVKDPVSLEYVALGQQEFAVLQLLDGRRTPQEIREQFERQFMPQRLTLLQLGAFVGRLHRLGLVLSDVSSQGAELLRRKTKQAIWSGAFSALNLLAIRFRGVDADAFLGRWERRCRWLFHPVFLSACALLILAAGLLVISRAAELQARLPQLEYLLRGENVLLLLTAIGAMKVLHELGHGLTCKHFGGECHEIGLMLLVFVPCLYCNVSDAWTFPRAGRRIAVSAAGILVEVTLAAGATFIWWLSQPGLVHDLALNVMILGTLNTLLFNGNPLLRYDGYYVLSDVAGVPNLAQHGQSALRRWAARVCLGLQPASEVWPVRHPRFVFAWGAASLCYRVLVVATILWMLDRVLRPQGLGTLSVLIAIGVVASLLAGSFIPLARWWRAPGVTDRIRRTRLATTVAILCLLAAGVLAVPIPQWVRATVAIEPLDAHPIYAHVPGRLLETAAPGQEVSVGDRIARLANIDLQLDVARLEARRDSQLVLRDSLEKRREFDAAAAREFREAEEVLTFLDRQLALLREDEAALTISTPRAGRVLPAPPLIADPEGAEHAPPAAMSWLDRERRGISVPKGTLLCLVGGSDRLQAVLRVDEADVEQVAIGQTVRVRMNALPMREFRGRVRAIAEHPADDRPHQDLSWSETWARIDGPSAPEGGEYEVRVELEQTDPRLRIGARGHAAILVRAEPLAVRIYRALRRTFGFHV